jgi:lipopolysaccharide/colanic/teichoic acid biosynthesis glycosyltransferase
MPDPVQRVVASILLLLSLPALCAFALWIRLDSPGPALYRGTRIGLGGRRFECYKLRTMRRSPANAPAITSGDDERITAIGRRLRRLRIDELPQLWNVVRGDMRLVGPRPETPEFVDPADPIWHRVLSVRPGIAGLAQLVFADEARLLAMPDAHATYRRDIQPRKLAIDACYVAHRSGSLDAWIIARTITVLVGRPATIDEVRRRAGCASRIPGPEATRPSLTTVG